jgi:hypothetical protein
VQSTSEQQRSFDILATVNLLRYDIEHFGEVLPQTRERVCDEELSSIAEGIDRASRTAFTLVKQENDLVYFHHGNWRSYTAMLLTGQQVARREAQSDFRRRFQAEWADRDLEIGYKLRSLQPGEVVTWTNGYPQEIEDTYGTKFMEDCGLVPRRKMGFVYRAECLDDGSVFLETQTLDQSDRAGFNAIQSLQEDQPRAEMDELVAAYDTAIMEASGRWVYAGRTDAAREENVWQDITANKDLIEYMVLGLEKIAWANDTPGHTKQKVIEHIVGVWKAFKMRLDTSRRDSLLPRRQSRGPLPVHMEVRQAYKVAQAQGDIKIGCGGAIRTQEDGQNGDFDPQATFDSIFNDGKGESKGSWKWKQGVCRVKVCPTRPGKTRVGPCEVCVRCQAKFDAGEDPTTSTPATAESAAAPRKFDIYAEMAKLLKEVVGDKESVDTQSRYELAA